MSILTNVLKSVFAPGEQPVPQPLPPDGPKASAPPGAEAAGDANAGKPVPAWRGLDSEIGVQEAVYADTARTSIRKLFGRLPRRVLDIGCATGAVGAELKRQQRGLWVWGCELNPAAAAIAATRLDHVSTAPRHAWSPEDLALLRTVDTVLLLDVLEHMYNPWQELEFLASQLPPHAQLIVSLPNIGHLSVLSELAHGRFPYETVGILDVTHVRFFTWEGMHDMFRETGFRVEESWILSSSPKVALAGFPAQVRSGKVALDVESAEEWDRMHAIQFGFRLGIAPPAAAAAG